jgi:hypothetical protein
MSARRYPLAIALALTTIAPTVGAAPTPADGGDDDASAVVAEDPAPAIAYELDASLRLLGAVMRNDPEVAFVGRNDGFRIQSARIGARAAWQDRITLRMSAEGADDEREAPNAIRGTLRFALEDAYADVELASAATLRLARFAIVYDLEELTPPSERAFVDRALPSRGVRPTEGFETRGLGLGRDLGVAVRAERAATIGHVALGYEVAVQNGAGSSASTNENDRVALSAAALARGPGLRSFVGVRHNTRARGELPALRTEVDVGVAGGLEVQRDRVRGAAQVFFEHTRFTTTSGPSRRAYGAHAQLLVEAAEGIELGYRYAILEPSDRIAASIVQEHTAGLNVAPRDLPVRLQLNVTRPVEQAGRSLRNDRLELVAEVSL